MDLVEQGYNFYAPVEVIEVFKNDGKEFSARANFLWEDLAQVYEYPYSHVEKWETYSGEKFYLKLFSDQNPKLVLGSYPDMVRYWTAFRNAVVEFTNGKDTEEEDNDGMA